MKQLKKHIVIVSSEFPPQPGGIGNHAFNLSKALSENDFEVTVIADQRSSSGEEERTFDNLQSFNIIRIGRKKIRLFMYLKRIQQTFKSIKQADVVIATGKFSLWNVALLSRFKTIRSLAIIHGSEVNFKSYFLRKSIDAALRRMNTLVAVSQYTKGLIAHLNLTCHVIPNGIVIKDWEMTSTENATLTGDPVLTTVGRVSSRKGQLNVIRHIPELIKDFPEIHYHCVGIPTEAKAFLKEAKELGVEQYVTFHGSVDAGTLKMNLSATDIFVMLSSETSSGDVEGFGIAILEANAMGIPAIGSKDCGIEDAIQNGKSGVLINRNDSIEFHNAIQDIQNNKATYTTNARQWAAKHDWSSVVKRYIELLT